MSDSDGGIGGVVRENWALVVAIGILIGGAAIVYVRGGSDESSHAADAAVVAVRQQGAVAATGQARQERETPQERALVQIGEHEAKVEADPEGEDAPAYLMAMGNLYRQKLVDYEKAAECYERLLADHSDWDSVRVVYMQLATCYERLDEKEKAKQVYEKMLDVFPADSQEYAIAHAAVYR